MRATTRARKFVRLSYKLPCVTLSYRDMVRRRGPTLGQFCDVFDLHAVALMRPHINEGNLYRRVSCISIVALTISARTTVKSVTTLVTPGIRLASRTISSSGTEYAKTPDRRTSPFSTFTVIPKFRKLGDITSAACTWLVMAKFSKSCREAAVS
jgi:hypothetical protein